MGTSYLFVGVDEAIITCTGKPAWGGMHNFSLLRSGAQGMGAGKMAGGGGGEVRPARQGVLRKRGMDNKIVVLESLSRKSESRH